jgi:hypothetical protein
MVTLTPRFCSSRPASYQDILGSGSTGEMFGAEFVALMGSGAWGRRCRRGRSVVGTSRTRSVRSVGILREIEDAISLTSETDGVVEVMDAVRGGVGGRIWSSTMGDSLRLRPRCLEMGEAERLLGW